MESGSLLPEALQHMELQRQLEHDGFFSCIRGESSHIDDGDGDGDATCDAASTPTGAAAALLRNALIISVYPLVSTDSVPDERSSKSAAATSDDENSCERRRHMLHEVARLGHLLNCIILPRLRKSVPYPWHVGGDGVVFGAECNMAARDDDNIIPHLRAVIRYGYCISDEWYAVALMYHIMEILSVQHEFGQQKVAVELLDADDGQFLLIEAAESLPPWVDELGVDGMVNRTWLFDGSIRIIPPAEHQPDGMGFVNGSGDYALSRAQALYKLLSSPPNATEAPKRVQEAILKKIQPFLEALRSDASRVPSPSSSMSEHLHRAAVVLPLDAAILVRNRPDLIPVAARAFCRHEGRKSESKGESACCTSIAFRSVLPFERLVTTVITLSRTTYAMLLTGEGMLPPPFAIPKDYRRVELNRMRRRLKNDALTDRFRHALEGGIRLSRGFEHLIRGSVDAETSPNTSVERGVSLGDSEERVCLHWSRLDVELGGDGAWMKDAWLAGPNGAQDDKACIEAFLKCPVYRPEVSRGGLWPLSYPGKSAWEVTRKAFHEASKSGLTETDFPTTREDEVDRDKWLDLDSPNSAENMMETASGSTNSGTAASADREKQLASDKATAKSVDDMLGVLQTFVQATGDFEGVNTKGLFSKGSTKEDSNKASLLDSGEAMLDRDIEIDPRSFVCLLHKSLKAASRPETSRATANIGLPDDPAAKNDMDLFFYVKDYENDNGSDSSSQVDDIDIEGNEGLASIKDAMAAMDSELHGTKVEREGDGNIDMFEEEGGGVGVPPINPVDNLSVDVSIISNLLKSLDAQGGGSGPASNVLKELGLDPPGHPSKS